MNREQWLQEAVKELTKVFESDNRGVPGVHVSVGWPSRGGTSKKKRTVGQCWNESASADGKAHVFVSPVLEDKVEVLSTLAHEMVHAIVGTEEGHKGQFITVAREFGFTSPWTQTPMGEDAEARLCKIADCLPDYPHVKLTPTEKERKVQTTRQRKVTCPQCECVVRMTKKWIDVGLPTCYCGAKMEAEDDSSNDPERDGL